MKKVLMVSALATIAGLMSGLVAAQEVGKVISSTPVMKRVTEPRSACTNDADGKQHCTTQMVSEDRQIGYKVVYEYAGRQHEAQLPFPPGATIPLDVEVSVPGAAPTPAMPSYSPAPQVIERYVREPVYVDPVYYPSRVYYPSYYYDPIYPIVGLALGVTAGYYGRWGSSRHWGGRAHWGGHRGR